MNSNPLPLTPKLRKDLNLTDLDEVARQFEATGSAIVAERAGARLIMKDEGDYVKVGMDTGSLTPTDVKLPSKTFATKEEAFDFIKSTADKPRVASQFLKLNQ
jgi:hypothetical protein